MEKISVVIPCYRSEQLLPGVLAELVATLESRNADYEVLLVSDASPDGVFEVIRRLAAENPRIKGIDLARNFGQHAALMAGYRHSSGEVVVSMDDDGQTPPSALWTLVDKLAEGYDVVYAAYPSIQQKLYRRLGTGLNKAMMETLLDKPKDIEVTSYFACRRFVVDEMLRYDASFPYIGGLVFRAAGRIANVPVTQRPRATGSSGYSLGKLIGLWVNGFTAFSIKPLRIATLIGSLCALGGFVSVLVVIVNKLFINPAAPLGYSSTMSALLFIGGMIMLMLGIIGEYIGRMYIGLNRSPQYVIRQTVNLGKDEPE